MVKKIFESLRVIYHFVRFAFSAKSIDTIDSPLVFRICEMLRKNIAPNQIISHTERRRMHLISNETLIYRQSLGSKSSMIQSESVSIAQLANTAVSPKYKCEILYKLIDSIRPEKVLELGTSLGISTSYISALDSIEYIDTVEGSQSIALYNSNSEFDPKIRFHNMSFQSFIDHAYARKTKYDCIFIDGHHTYDATLSYVNQLKELLNPKGYIIIDDIYWSSDMIKAWEELRNDSYFNLKINMFFFGVISNQNSIKEIIDVKLSPIKFRYQLGLFR